MIKYLLFLVLMIAFSMEPSAQRMSEEEIGLEDLYIQANQKKILGKYEDALKIYAQILEKQPLNAPAHYDVARIQSELGEKEKAIDHAKKATKYDPQNKWYQLTLATLYENNMEYRNAARSYNALARQHNDQDLYDRWADALVEAGDIEEAIGVYDQADAKWGSNTTRSDTKVDLYLSIDKKKEAIQEVEQWVKDYPYEDKFKIKLSQFFLFLGEEKKAKKVLEGILSDTPDNEDALAMLQAMKVESGSIESSDLTTLLDNPSISVDAKIKTIMPIITKGEQQELKSILPSLRTIASEHPQVAKAQAIYADALYLTGDLVGAINGYNKTLALNKSVYEVWDQLMRCLQLAEKTPELSAVAEEALDYYPNQAGPYYYQAVVAYNKGDDADAKELIDEAILVSGGQGVGAVESLILKAKIINDGGDTSQAIALLESGEVEITIPGGYEYLGDLKLLNGDKAGAEMAYKKALTIGGPDGRLQKKISSI